MSLRCSEVCGSRSNFYTVNIYRRSSAHNHIYDCLLVLSFVIGGLLSSLLMTAIVFIVFGYVQDLLMPTEKQHMLSYNYKLFSTGWSTNTCWWRNARSVVGRRAWGGNCGDLCLYWKLCIFLFVSHQLVVRTELTVWLLRKHFLGLIDGLSSEGYNRRYVLKWRDPCVIQR